MGVTGDLRPSVAEIIRRKLKGDHPMTKILKDWYRYELEAYRSMLHMKPITLATVKSAPNEKH